MNKNEKGSLGLIRILAVSLIIILIMDEVRRHGRFIELTIAIMAWESVIIMIEISLAPWFIYPKL